MEVFREAKTHERPRAGAVLPSLSCKHMPIYDRHEHIEVCIKCGLVLGTRWIQGYRRMDNARGNRYGTIFYTAYRELRGKIDVYIDVDECWRTYKALVRTFQPRSEYEKGGLALLSIYMVAVRSGARKVVLRRAFSRVGRRLRYYKHYVRFRRMLNGRGY